MKLSYYVKKGQKWQFHIVQLHTWANLCQWFQAPRWTVCARQMTTSKLLAPRTWLFMMWPRFHTLWGLHPVYQMASLSYSWQRLLITGGHSSPNNTDEEDRQLGEHAVSLAQGEHHHQQETKTKRRDNLSLLPFQICLLKFIFIQFIHFSGLYWVEIWHLNTEMNQKAKISKCCSCNFPPRDWWALFGFTFWSRRMALMGKQQNKHNTNEFLLHKK